MKKILQAATLMIYTLGILPLFTPVLGSAGIYFSYFTLIAFVGHILEALCAAKYLKLHPGGMLQSIVLCILFGLLHWLPLKKQYDARHNIVLQSDDN